jgi:hypothetical protein
MLDVLAGFYSKLSNNATLKGYISDRFFYGIAPKSGELNPDKYDGTSYPYLVFQKIMATKSFSQDSTYHTLTIQIDCCDKNSSAVNIETIAGVIDGMLNLRDGSITIAENYVLIYVKKIYEATIPDSDNVWRYTARFELEVQEV